VHFAEKKILLKFFPLQLFKQLKRATRIVRFASCRTPKIRRSTDWAEVVVWRSAYWPSTSRSEFESRCWQILLFM